MCLFCPAIENEAHVFGIRRCVIYEETRERIINDLQKMPLPFKICFDDDKKFIQFFADPSSFNLDHSHRVNLNNHDDTGRMFKVCRDYVFAILNIRKRKIKESRM